MNSNMYSLETLKGCRSFEDQFFAEGDAVCEPYKRLGFYDDDIIDLCPKTIPEFPCSVPECTSVFTSVVEYEEHYNSVHRYRCAECKKWLPSPHLLDLHISEQHDSFFQILAERKPMYACFLPVCDDKFMTSIDRRKHCLEKHNFPTNFRFDISNKKVNTSNNKLQCDNAMDVDNTCKKSKKKKKKKNANKNGESMVTDDNIQQDVIADENAFMDTHVSENIVLEKQPDVELNKSKSKNICHFTFGHSNSSKKMWHSKGSSAKKKPSVLENTDLEKDMRDSLPVT